MIPMLKKKKKTQEIRKSIGKTQEKNLNSIIAENF